jgi:hypothetical protein
MTSSAAPTSVVRAARGGWGCTSRCFSCVMLMLGVLHCRCYSHLMRNPLARQRQVYANFQDSRSVSHGHTIKNKIVFFRFPFFLSGRCTS